MTPHARVATIAVFCVAGCATRQSGRLYSMSDGRVTAIVVDDAKSPSGVVSASLPSGEACNGDFTTVGEGARNATDVAPLIGRNSETGVVLLQCGPHGVLKCVVARRPGEGFSYGSCKDQTGVEYAMIF